MFKRKNVVLTRETPRGPPARDAKTALPTKDPRNGPARAPPHQHSVHPSLVHSPLVRPSVVDSVPCVTTGSRTLDKALGHGGVPIGSVTLVEEHGTTDFSAALLKSGAAIAVSSARATAKGHGNPVTADASPSALPRPVGATSPHNGSARPGAPRVICLGIPEWLRALPTVVDPSKSRKGTARAGLAGAEAGRMRIAWRYAKYAGAGAEATDAPNAFCPDVDFKTTLVPAPQSHEVAYVLGRSLDELVRGLKTALAAHAGHVRVLVPSFLHPAVYAPEACDPAQMLPFLDRVGALVREHGNAVAFVSLPLQLYPRTQSVVAAAELLVDTCVELEPFDSGDDKVQGFLHINRISKLSDRGENVEQSGELSFKLGRYQFEVSPYAIPVEVQQDTDEKEPGTNW